MSASENMLVRPHGRLDEDRIFTSRTERQPSMLRGRRRDAICIFVLCVVTLLSWIPRSRGPIDLRWDAGVYYVLGTSLAQGKGYRLLNEPGDIIDIQYPPLLPAIVAVHQLALGTSDPVVVGRYLRITWIFLSLLYVTLTFVLVRMFLPIGYAVVSALVCMLTFEMYFLSTLLFTELPFGVTTLLFAVLYYRKDSSQLSRVGAAAGAIASYLLRTVGIAALAAWVFDALLRRHLRDAVVRSVVALVPVLMWQGYIHGVQSGDEYQRTRYSYQRDPTMFYNVSYATNVALKDPFQPELGRATRKDFAKRFLENVKAAPRGFEEAIGGRRDFWFHDVFEVHSAPRLISRSVWVIVRLSLYLVAAFTFAGIVLQLWRRQWVISLYVVFSLAALGTSPWPGQTLRYLSPMVPFFLLAMFVCLHRLAALVRELPYRWAKFGSVAVAVYLPVFTLAGSVSGFAPGIRNYLATSTYQGRDGVDHPYTLVWFPKEFAAFHSALQWLRRHAPRDEIAAVSMPHWTYIETGLKSVMTPFQSDPATVQRLLESVPVSYLIVETTGSYNTHLPQVVKNSQDKWELVYSSIPSGAEVYHRIASDTSRGIATRQP